MLTGLLATLQEPGRQTIRIRNGNLLLQRSLGRELDKEICKGTECERNLSRFSVSREELCKAGEDDELKAFSKKKGSYKALGVRSEI